MALPHDLNRTQQSNSAQKVHKLWCEKSGEENKNSDHFQRHFTLNIHKTKLNTSFWCPPSKCSHLLLILVLNNGISILIVTSARIQGSALCLHNSYLLTVFPAFCPLLPLPVPVMAKSSPLRSTLYTTAVRVLVLKSLSHRIWLSCIQTAWAQIHIPLVTMSKSSNLLWLSFLIHR